MKDKNQNLPSVSQFWQHYRSYVPHFWVCSLVMHHLNYYFPNLWLGSCPVTHENSPQHLSWWTKYKIQRYLDQLDLVAKDVWPVSRSAGNFKKVMVLLMSSQICYQCQSSPYQGYSMNFDGKKYTVKVIYAYKVTSI